MNRIFGVGTRMVLTVAAPAALLLGAVQLSAQVGTAKLHGRVINAAGSPVTHGNVKLTLDKGKPAGEQKFLYTMALDAGGMYTGKEIAPGDYLAVVDVDGKTPDFQNVTIKQADDKTLDFDMTRAEYIKALSPEDRAALEEFKKTNAKTSAENAKINNINGVLTKARSDMKEGHPDDAVKSLQDLAAQKPDEAVIWATLGDAQLAVADKAAKAAKDAKKSPSDPDLVAKYQETADTYKKAIDLNGTSKKPSPELVSSSSWNQGVAYAKAGKMKESSDAFDAGAKALPANAGKLYDTELATLFNLQKLDGAVPIADKAIAADPKNAINYYIKGQALIPGAQLDPKTQKYTLPAGCLEAYQMYLELEPNGRFAPDVKALLQGLGQPVTNSIRNKR